MTDRKDKQLYMRLLCKLVQENIVGEKPIVKIYVRGDKYWIILREPPDEGGFDQALLQFHKAWKGREDTPPQQPEGIVDEQASSVPTTTEKKKKVCGLSSSPHKSLKRKIGSYKLVKIYTYSDSIGVDKRNTYVDVELKRVPERGCPLFVGFVMPDSFVFDANAMTIRYYPSAASAARARSAFAAASNSVENASPTTHDVVTHAAIEGGSEAPSTPTILSTCFRCDEACSCDHDYGELDCTCEDLPPDQLCGRCQCDLLFADLSEAPLSSADYPSASSPYNYWWMPHAGPRGGRYSIHGSGAKTYREFVSARGGAPLSSAPSTYNARKAPCLGRGHSSQKSYLECRSRSAALSTPAEPESHARSGAPSSSAVGTYLGPRGGSYSSGYQGSDRNSYLFNGMHAALGELCQPQQAEAERHAKSGAPSPPAGGVEADRQGVSSIRL